LYLAAIIGSDALLDLTIPSGFYISDGTVKGFEQHFREPCAVIGR